MGRRPTDQLARTSYASPKAPILASWACRHAAGTMSARDQRLRVDSLCIDDLTARSQAWPRTAPPRDPLQILVHCTTGGKGSSLLHRPRRIASREVGMPTLGDATLGHLRRRVARTTQKQQTHVQWRSIERATTSPIHHGIGDASPSRGELGEARMLAVCVGADGGRSSGGTGGSDGGLALGGGCDPNESPRLRTVGGGDSGEGGGGG